MFKPDPGQAGSAQKGLRWVPQKSAANAALDLTAADPLRDLSLVARQTAWATAPLSFSVLIPRWNLLPVQFRLWVHRIVSVMAAFFALQGFVIASRESVNWNAAALLFAVGMGGLLAWGAYLPGTRALGPALVSLSFSLSAGVATALLDEYTSRTPFLFLVIMFVWLYQDWRLNLVALVVPSATALVVNEIHGGTYLNGEPLWVMPLLMIVWMVFLTCAGEAFRRILGAERLSSARLAELTVASRDAIIVAVPDEESGGPVVHFATPSVRQFGWSAPLMRRVRWNELAHPEDVELLTPEIALNGGKLQFRFPNYSQWKLNRGMPLDPDDEAPRYTWAESAIGLGALGDMPGSYISMVRDISDRRDTEQRLREARNEAVNALKSQDRFLAVVSHELRTPANVIKGLSEMLLEAVDEDETLDREQMHEDLRTVVSSAAHLAALIEDVLAVSAGTELQVSPSNVDVVPVCESVVRFSERVAEDAGVVLSLQVPDQPLPRIHVDRVRLQQVVTNLVTNAIKYNQPGGTVVIRCRFDPDGEVRGNVAGRVLIEVEDSGIGMDAEQLEQAFELFNRAGQNERGTHGHGVGLAVARQLTHSLGGELTAMSAPERGSLFTVALPVPVATQLQTAL